jgi:DNA gyrase/topoisomerase IV subunit A
MPDQQPPSDEARRTQMQKRLAVLDAYVATLERKGEVMETVGEAGDRDEAVRAIGALLSISPPNSEAVLDLRLTRFTREDAQMIRAERADLETLIRDEPLGA